MFCRSSTVVLLALALAACSRDTESRGTIADSAAGAAGAAGAAVDGSETDGEQLDLETAAALTLIRELADRDEALIEMGRLAITRREQLQVSSEARRLLTEQRRESNRLLGMLKAEYRVSHLPSISAEDQVLLDSLNGVGVGGFDGTFLEIVAAHHEYDAQLIERGLPSITSPKLRETLSAIRDRRTSEASAFRKQLATR